MKIINVIFILMNRDYCLILVFDVYDFVVLDDEDFDEMILEVR